MRIINTSIVVDPNKQQPFLTESLDFLTQNQIETLSSLAQTLIGPSYSSTQVYVLWGCVVTGVTAGAGNFAMTAGAVFYGGEIFQVAAVSTVAVGSGNTVYSLLNSVGTTTDPYDNTRALDPVTFSDGSTNSVHLTRTWVTSIQVTGTGGYSNAVGGWIYLDLPVLNTVGTSPAFGSGYTAANRLVFWKDAQGLVHIQGDFTANGSTIAGIFTLPAGYRPAVAVNGFLGFESNIGSGNAALFGINITTAGVVNTWNTNTYPLPSGVYYFVLPAFATN
jgi:hypothetical protein